jgi:hypothetical protein
LARGLKYQTAGKISAFKAYSTTPMGMFCVPGNKVVFAFMTKNHFMLLLAMGANVKNDRDIFA